MLTILFFGILWMAALALSPLFFSWLQRTIKMRLNDKQIEQKLAGRDRKKLLAESPYRYDHWQGDDGYRVFDEREMDRYLAFVHTAKEAEDTILKQIFADEANDAILLD
ncbi:MAG TPA: hypothetical protein ENJ56_05825 [Anaerolineae bacterium]|nr:hypothetical protein [Anaerolineae bacterium]